CAIQVDDIMIRNRYPRQSIQNRRKTRKIKKSKEERESFTIIQKLILQTVLCVLLLTFGGIIKGVDSTVTNYLENKIVAALSYNIDIKGFFSQIDDIIQRTDGLNSDTGILKTQDDNSSSNSQNENYNINDNDLSLQEKDISDEILFEEKMVDSISYNSDDEIFAEDRDFLSEHKEYSFIIPVGGTISSFFGEQLNMTGDISEYSKGINIEAGMDTSIKAAYSGEVLETGENSEKGNFIKIKHGKNMVTIYACCSKVLVEKGQYVDKGDIIAKVGNTGKFKNPSLYFVLLKEGVPVNPLDYIGGSVE
ncbi:M23 family metallopeptidase, partial [Herbivorax sp. ANBcel31]|uniref:M23 family metallopeptidase n=1 Tax=Herbivorax sp. ANBcel31 TaxID=3069754 RepID=UPI0027B32C08